MLWLMMRFKSLAGWVSARPERILIALVILASVFAYFYHVRTVSALEDRLRDTRNQLSDAIGTVEISDGVYARQAEDIKNLNRRISEVLGENTRLEGLIGDRDARIVSLAQANATLSERISFSSDNPDSSATVTVIEGCPDSDGQNETGDPTAVPNIRVDFDLERGGFEIVGFTTTNPTLAELSLTQVDPFIVDLALTEARDGTYQVFVSEQNDRLRLEIGEFAVSRRQTRERWFELFGVGLTAAWTPDNPLLGPAIHLETRRRLDLTFGALWNLRDGTAGGHVSATFRPFRRRR